MSGFPDADEEVTYAENFVAKLLESPSGDTKPSFRSPWVYRGHGNADWELKPPAWRTDGQLKLRPIIDYVRPNVALFLNRLFNGLPSSHMPTKKIQASEIARCTQIVAEVFAVYQFYQLADELGLSIPGGEKILELEDLIRCATNNSTVVSFPRDLDFPAGPALFPPQPFAFAQHHGIPTRFLDWTRNPLAAAWFAANSAGGNTDEKICVWATDTTKRTKDAGKDSQWIQVPRHAHSYLHAQDGIFSLRSGRKLDILAKNITGVGPAFNTDGNEAHKLVLPYREVPKLLRLLHERRISKAHLMPTFDSVGVTTQSTWFWLDPILDIAVKQ